VKTNSYKRLNILRSLKYKLIRAVLQKIYFLYIRPILEYADIVWHNCTKQEQQELESVQLEAIRIVTGATKLTSHAQLYKESGWDTLVERRKKHKLIQCHKMLNGLAPPYLENLLTQHAQNERRLSLRNTSDIPPPFCRTTLYQNSFLPSVIRDWNDIPSHVRENCDVNTLKRFLNKDCTKPPTYYNFGNRQVQIYHARLRMGCSSLNSHLYKRNLSENALCTCLQIETVKHYLLECPNFSNIRKDTLGKIPHISNLTTLLFGNNLLSTDENENIFVYVQTYIKQTNRFK
jgi:hypothetical protein